MQHEKMAKQMFEFQKMFFENTFNAMTMLQDQTEQMITNFMGKIPGMSESQVNVMAQTIQFYKTIFETYKTTMEEGIKHFESLFNQCAEKEEKE